MRTSFWRPDMKNTEFHRNLTLLAGPILPGENFSPNLQARFCKQSTPSKANEPQYGKHSVNQFRWSFWTTPPIHKSSSQTTRFQGMSFHTLLILTFEFQTLPRRGNVVDRFEATHLCHLGARRVTCGRVSAGEPSSPAALLPTCLR